MKKSAVVLGLLGAILVPVPAFAWFGWLDKLSGPGPFKGLLFDVRVVCFGEKYQGPDLSDALGAIRKAETLEQRAIQDAAAAEAEYAKNREGKNLVGAVSLYQTAVASRVAASDSWDTALQAWQASDLGWAILAGIPPNDPRLRGPLTADYARAPGQPTDDPETTIRISKDRIQLIQARIELTKPEIKKRQQSVYDLTQQVAFTRSVGVLVSACAGDKNRRSSIDVGAGLWKVFKESSPTTGDQLTTLRAAYVFRLASFLDYSSGAGVFWVTSDRYDTVRGLYIEPARLHVHFPDSWNTLSIKQHWAKRILAVPVLTVGPTVFPNGFREGAFTNETGASNDRIKGEVIWNSFAIHVNIRPAARKLKVE